MTNEHDKSEHSENRDDLADTALPFHYLSFFQLAQSVLLALLLGLTGLIALDVIITPLPEAATHSLLVWLAIAFIFVVVVVPKSFTIGFLGALFAQLVAWRIASLYFAYLLSLPLALVFLLNLFWFLTTIQRNSWETAGRGLTLFQWQVTFFRILFGFLMVPHFTDKLFAGPLPYMEHLEFFTLLGVPNPGFVIDAAALCELAIAIGVGFGLLTRLFAFLGAAFILYAASMSGALQHGFVSFVTAGPWELPLLLFAGYLSFTTTGAGEFSVDGALRRTGKVPQWLSLFMGNAVSEQTAKVKPARQDSQSGSHI